MADFNINPKFIDTLQRSAGAIVAQKVAQQFSPKTVRDIQRILQFSDFLQGALGLGQDVESLPQPLLGGITLSKAREIYSQLNDVRLARKNLFYIEVEDPNPPALNLVPRSAVPSPVGSPLGTALSTFRAATSGGLGGLITSAIKGAFPAGGSAASSDPNVSHLFNLFSTNVSYTPDTMTGERIHFGAASMDKLMGTEPTELQITTMDDEVGTLKRWFAGKFAQAAHTDGTFGLPNEYCVTFTVYHAVPQADPGAYKSMIRMRPQSIQHEMSRSDQAMSEVQMTFTQFDTFAAP